MPSGSPGAVVVEFELIAIGARIGAARECGPEAFEGGDRAEVVDLDRERVVHHARARDEAVEHAVARCR